MLLRNISNCMLLLKFIMLKYKTYLIHFVINSTLWGWGGGGGGGCLCMDCTILIPNLQSNEYLENIKRLHAWI